jgi:hypothetical protein
MEALALPFVGPLIVSQAESLEAVHEQPVNVCRFTVTEPPVGGTVALDGVKLYRHGAGSCAMVRLVSLTATVPLRCAGSAFGETAYVTDALPCPDNGAARTIQDAWLFADHVQSRVVVTDSVPEPPDEGTELPTEFVTDTWHFTPVGAFTSTEDEPHAAPIDESAQARNSRARMRPSVLQTR